MRTYLAVAPVWVVAFLNGLLFAVVWAAGMGLQDHQFGRHLVVIGLGVGAVSGVATGFAVRRQRRRIGPIVGALSANQRRAVSRAVATGTPPENPGLRAAGVAMAHNALAEHTRTKTASLATCAVLAVASALLAIDSWWYLVAVAVFVAAIISVVRYPKRLRKRIASLERADAQPVDRPIGAQ